MVSGREPVQEECSADQDQDRRGPDGRTHLADRVRGVAGAQGEGADQAATGAARASDALRSRGARPGDLSPGPLPWSGFGPAWSDLAEAPGETRRPAQARGRARPGEADASPGGNRESRKVNTKSRLTRPSGSTRGSSARRWRGASWSIRWAGRSTARAATTSSSRRPSSSRPARSRRSSSVSARRSRRRSAVSNSGPRSQNGHRKSKVGRQRRRRRTEAIVPHPA